MTIYERIRQLRVSQKMSQSDLARKMGYRDGSMITKIESGLVDISQKKILQFADALGTTPAYLMGWTDSPVRTTDERLTIDEHQVVVQYRALPDSGKQYIHQQLRAAQLMFGEKSAPVSDSHDVKEG